MYEIIENNKLWRFKSIVLGNRFRFKCFKWTRIQSDSIWWFQLALANQIFNQIEHNGNFASIFLYLWLVINGRFIQFQ